MTRTQIESLLEQHSGYDLDGGLRVSRTPVSQEWMIYYRGDHVHEGRPVVSGHKFTSYPTCIEAIRAAEQVRESEWYIAAEAERVPA